MTGASRWSITALPTNHTATTLAGVEIDLNRFGAMKKQSLLLRFWPAGILLLSGARLPVPQCLLRDLFVVIMPTIPMQSPSAFRASVRGRVITRDSHPDTEGLHFLNSGGFR